MRRSDSGWRDTLLTTRHRLYGYDCPASGMYLPMIEYDRGVPVGVVNYIRRGDGLPLGPDAVAAHQAMSNLHEYDGTQLPFITCVYDPRNWAMRLFPHNDAARGLLGFNTWRPVVESDFVAALYRMRDRKLPDLSSVGVTWSEAQWLDDSHGAPEPVDSWPGQDMSVRRRCYEPAVSIPFRQRIPCTDMDLAVPATTTGGLALVVDYKAPGAKVTVGNTNMKALSGLVSRWNQPQNGRVGAVAGHRKVAAMVVKYAPVKPAWAFEVHCLNDSAERLLTSVMLDTNAVAWDWTPGDWTYVDESRWQQVLDYARSF